MSSRRSRQRSRWNSSAVLEFLRDWECAPLNPDGRRVGSFTWVHLRLCMTCGHVGCCDNSKNKHATKHVAATQHPIIMSYERGEQWGWCYIDQGYFESLP